MNCKKCGYELKNDWKACPMCSQKTNEELKKSDNKDITKETNISKVDSNNEKVYIYVFIYLAGVIASFFSDNLFIFALLISLISIITGYIRYPRNVIINILFWLSVILTIIFIVYFIIAIIACNTAMNNCVGSLSSF